jgi:DMSO/TMAO reductase YedYZ molybdopterin-dependent catalytic subunit
MIEAMKAFDDHYARRRFLTLGWQTGVAAAVSRLMPRVSSYELSAQASSPAERRIIRSMRPQDWETPVGLLDSWITPNELFYVRCHFYTPTVDVAAWTLTIDGEVDRPQTLGMADIRQMPRVTLPVTLECAGNGRAFFDPPVAGTQWQRGAVGNARWTGVRLSDVLKRAGLKTSGRYLWLDGADRPLGTAPDFNRQLPIAKALHQDTLLAYEMNGQPLPVANGFPLRLLVPGWEGAYSVKWLTHIQVSDRENDSFWVQTAYRYPKMNVAPGAAVDPKDMGPLTGLAVKSIITAPAAGRVALGQPVAVTGFAWAGEANVVKVDVSTDNGSTWTPATLGKDKAQYAWRQFQHSWKPTERGSFVVLSRATDDTGHVQPSVERWNPSGYLWNVIDQVRVDVE